MDGTATARPLYVLGDSHSLALYAGFKNSFFDRKLIFYNWSGCEFFTSRYAFHNTEENIRQCAAQRKTAYDAIRDNPGDIIIAQRWLNYTQRRPTLQRIDSNDTFNLDAEGYTGLEGRARFIGEELKYLQQQFPQSNLLVIGPVPEFGKLGSPTDCIIRPWGGETCSITTTASKEIARRKILDSLLTAELQSRGIHYFSLWPTLCTNAYCRNTVNTMPIYADRDHLSLWGAQDVIVTQEKALRKAMQRTSP